MSRARSAALTAITAVMAAGGVGIATIVTIVTWAHRRVERQHREALLDHTLAASFPASDPPPF